MLNTRRKLSSEWLREKLRMQNIKLSKRLDMLNLELNKIKDKLKSKPKWT